MNPSIVTFDQAFKLKNKGFNEYCYYSYNNNKELIEPKLTNPSSTDTDFTVELTELEENYNRYDSSISAPEHWMVIEWLRVKHNIFILTPYSYNDGRVYIWTINKIDEEESDKNCFLSGIDTDKLGFKTPQEATSAAIDYVLDNLL